MDSTTPPPHLPQLELVLARFLGLSPEQILPQLRRGTVERWDSLGHIELIEAIHRELGVEISLDEALGMETVQDVRRIVAARLSNPEAP